MNNEPRPYNLDDPEEIQRWFKEMRGYLRNFVDNGTDTQGRLYALKAFNELENKLTK